MTTKLLGKYELLDEIGHGGYGTVYRARETVLGIDRAVKVLKPALLAAPEFIELFRREARISASMDHPNIVPVYELGEYQGFFYLSMKYMSGGSLKDLIERQGRLPFSRAQEITRQIASALDYAYWLALDSDKHLPLQLVHRDLKPSNILFDADGSARLSDFGFAKAMTDASRSSQSSTGGLIGTPSYMAPEAWEGGEITSAIDQYSLACVVYEMLMGEVLFTGNTPPEVMTKHILRGPQFPVKWRADLPEGVENVLLKALAKKPDDRYEDMKAFVNALRGLREAKAKPMPELPRPSLPTADGSRDGMKSKGQRETDEMPGRIDSPKRQPGPNRPGWIFWIGGAILLVILTCGLLAGIWAYGDQILNSLTTATITTATPPLPAISGSTSPPPKLVASPTAIINGVIPTTGPSGGLTTFTDKNNYYQIDLPANWEHTQSSATHYYIDTFTSPDKKAVIENIAYDDGTPFTSTNKGSFALQILNQNYSSPGKQGDISVTDDSIQKDNSERLTWTSKGGGYSGLSYFEIRNQTTFLMFTIDWSNDSQSTYIGVLDKVVSSYRIP